MKFIDSHIKKHLTNFINSSENNFDEIFALLPTENKEIYIELLKYVNRLLDENDKIQQDDFVFFHIHFEQDLDDEFVNILSQFLVLKYHLMSLQDSTKLEDDFNEILLSKRNEIRQKIIRLSRAPDDASGARGNRIYKRWLKEKKYCEMLSSFYNSFDEKTVIEPINLFNTKLSTAKILLENFAEFPYLTDLENENNDLTFNRCNPNLSLHQVDKLHSNFIDNCEKIFLIDCERKKNLKTFSFNELKSWKKENGLPIKQMVLFSFGKSKINIENIRTKLKRLKDIYKIPESSTYVVLNSEINKLLRVSNNHFRKISFFGADENVIWDTLQLECSIRDLYELKSNKLLNIYGLCINEEIKDFIIDDLFSEHEYSKLISAETKFQIMEMTEKDLKEFKETFVNFLDSLIDMKFADIINNHLNTKKTLILPNLFVENEYLSKLLLHDLKSENIQGIVNWKSVQSCNVQNFLILSFQDQGKRPFYFYPNLLEFYINHHFYARGAFVKFLWLNQYNWSKYNLANDFRKIIEHPIRNTYFDIVQLKKQISSIKPEKTISIDWEFESRYSHNLNRSVIKVKFQKISRSKTYPYSSLFIVRANENSELRVLSGDELQNYDLNEEIIEVQSLDDILEETNIFEKFAETKNLEEELKIIRKKFDVHESETGRLWKILLKRKCIKSSESDIYKELTAFLDSKGSKMVSFKHFDESWTNPESEAFAPLSKKAFLGVCEYLDLGTPYYIIIQRLRNSSKQATRQSTHQMTLLLCDLFNDGCFDDLTKTTEVLRNRLSKYQQTHSLQDIGIDQDNLLVNLKSLVDIVNDEIKLKIISKIEIVSNE